MRKKIIFIASLIILFLLAVNLLFRGGLFSESLKNYLVYRLEKEFHASVSINKVRLNLFPSFLNIEELTLKDKKEISPPFLKADHLTISFSPISLFTEYLLIHRIQILGPEIHLIWDENGKTNFDSLLQAVSPDRKFPLIIQKIVIMNGSLDINQKSKRSRAIFSSFDLKLESDPKMTNVQISGSTKETFLQWDNENQTLFSNSEWRLAINPNHVDIKKLTLVSNDGSLASQGIVNLVPIQGEYPFKIEADFHINPKKKRMIVDRFSGHGQLIGNFNPKQIVTGNLKLSQIAVETGKTSHPLGEFKGHFSYHPSLLRIDKFKSDFFGAAWEGSLTLAGEKNISTLESEYEIRHLALNKLAFLSSSPEKKYLEGKIIDTSGRLKMINYDPHQIESEGHIHLVKSGEVKTDPKNPFIDNLLLSLSFADADYRYNPSSLSFQSASLKIGSSLIQGNGSLQKNGTLQTFFSLQSEKGGEILTWLGYPQWSGNGEFSGEIQGTLSSPILQGKGSVKDVFFENHSLGDGTTDLKYSNKELSFTNARVNKGRGRYSGEGFIHWETLNKFSYQISAQAFHGIPNDIISVFIEHIPLDTAGSGPVTIAGDDQTIRVKGNIELEEGLLYGETFDKGHVEFEISEKEILFPNAFLAHGDSSISGKGRILFEGAFEGELLSDYLQLEAITFLNRQIPDMTGSFKGRISGNGTFDHPRLKLKGILSEMGYHDQKLKNGLIEISLEDKKLLTDLKFDEHPIQMNGSVVLSEPFNSKFEIQGEQIPFTPLLAATTGTQWTSFNGTFSGKLEIEGPLSHLQSLNYSASLNQLDANLAGYSVSNRGDLIFQINNGTLNIESFNLKGEGTTLSITGGLQLFKQFNLFITGEADLALLKAFSRDISYGQGKAYLALNIFDTWSDPKFQGGLTIQEGQIRTSFFPQPFKISSMGLFLNERQIFLESLDAALGEGILHVTGKIDMNRFKMGHFGLILETRESRFTFLPGWASTVSGTLIYGGDLSAQNLQGEVTVSHGIYNKKFDLKPLLKKLIEIRENRRQPIPVVGNTRLNIHLSGEDDLRVNNNVARLPFTTDLTLKGTIDHPVLIGRMESDSGFIIFDNKTFTVSSITVDFIDPEEIKPLIDLKARTQIVGKDRNYQIDLSLSGTLEEAKPTLTADDPALTETDILSLILAGKKATDVSTDPAAQQTVGGSFVPLVIESPFEGLLEELTGVNRLSIEPVSPPSLRSTGGPRVSVEQHLLNDKLLLNYSYIMNPTQDQLVQMDYLLNRHMYLQGIRNEDGTVGGNLKFRFEFK